MKIESIDKATAVMLGDEIMAAVDKIAAKYGLQAKRGGGRYGEGEYKLNSVVMFVPQSAGGAESVGRYTPSQVNKMVVNFNMKKGMHGLQDANCGDTYFDRDKGCDMKLIGWDSKKRKYPCLVECTADGSIYKMTPYSLKGKLDLF